MRLYNTYMEDVLSERQPVNEYIRLAVERHANDLDKSKRGDIPFIFSEERANHVIDFFPTMKIPSTLHPKGKPFQLEPWQAFSTAVTFGWQKQHMDTGNWVRRFNLDYEEIPRKNGKTARAAGFVPYCMLVEAPESAEIYSAATKLSQAEIVFKMAKSILRKYKREHVQLRRRSMLEILSSNVTYFPKEVIFEPLPAISDKLDGLGPYLALIDEFQGHPDDELIKVIETGMGKWEESLLFIITTAGRNIYGPCYRYRKRIIDVLRGIVKDDSSCGMIYCPDPQDDWEDPEVWYKVNPNVGVTVYRDYLHTQYNKAITEGRTAENQFKTKNLNLWLSGGNSWISDAEWMASGTDWDEDILKGRKCWVGMDLSTSKDLTVLVYYFPPTENDPKYRVRWRFFCPEEQIEKRSKRDKVDYLEWASDGLIKATPGASVKYKYLVEDLEYADKAYNIRHFEYDKALAFDIMKDIHALLGEKRCTAYPQDAKSMHAPIIRIEGLIADKVLDHGNHPIARWNVSNVVTKTVDDKIKFNKNKIVERIDGMDALAMAVGGHITDHGVMATSKYVNQKLTVI